MIEFEGSEKFNTDEVECPHCDNAHSDSWEFPDSGYIDCHSCEKEFFMERNITVTYTSNKVKS